MMMSGLRVVDSGVSSKGRPPVPIPGQTAGDSVWLGLGQLVSDPLYEDDGSQKWLCLAGHFLLFSCPRYLRALPTPCHGTIYISPGILFSTLTECGPSLLHHQPTQSSLSPHLCSLTLVGKVSHSAQNRMEIGKGSGSLHVMVLLGIFHLVQAP